MFAMLDDRTSGPTVTIPLVLIARGDGEALRSLLSIKEEFAMDVIADTSKS
jgi:hypothetical protein